MKQVLSVSYCISCRSPPILIALLCKTITSYSEHMFCNIKFASKLILGRQLLLIKPSWAKPDFRFLRRREVGIHFNTQTCTRRQKSGGTNQIAVSVAVVRNTYLRLREAHYHPPVATGVRMAEETKERILLAGGLLEYPSIKQE